MWINSIYIKFKLFMIFQYYFQFTVYNFLLTGK